jgi:CPA1 family monovalent cation:H+ antiporter
VRVRLAPHRVKLLTRSALRGGFSVALALAPRGHLPANRTDVLLVIAYVVVVFSVLGQGLSINPVPRRYRSATAG